MSRQSEYLDELFVAVFQGDVTKAQGILAEMRAVDIWSDAIMRARKVVNPLPEPELASPVALPVPGHEPGTFGWSKLAA